MYNGGSKEPGALVTVVLAIAAPVAVALVPVALGHAPVPGGPVVATTFQGLAGDLEMLLGNCSVGVWIVAPGGDPHEALLRPSDALALERALLVVSTGHTGLEARLRQVVPGDRLLEVPGIEGLRLKRLPEGGVNMHMPIYDPGNYIAYIRALESALAERIPDCAPTIHGAAARAEARAEGLLESYQGILGGRPAVASEPPGQYAIEWLGARVEVVLSHGHGAGPSPEAVEEATRILTGGGIAVIVVDDSGRPLTQAGRWLESLAREAGAPVIRVPAPGLPQPTIEKIEYVVNQSLEAVG